MINILVLKLKYERSLYTLIIIVLIEHCVESKLETYFNSTVKINRIHELTNQIMEYCFSKNESSTVLFGNLYEKNFNDYRVLASIPLVTFRYDQYSILQNNRRLQGVYIFNESHIFERLYPAKSVLLLVSSDKTFITIIESIRESIWWNSEAHILIVNKNVESRCKMANLFLSILWSFNILNAIYLCEHHNNLYLYTFNPFGAIAPKFWHEVKVDKIDDKYWTLFVYPMDKFHGSLFDNGSSVCHTLYYDKANHLNGYNLKAVVNTNFRIVYDITKVGYDRCKGANAAIICSIFKYMNATVTVKLSSSFGVIDDQNTTFKIISLKHSVDSMDKLLFVFPSRFWLFLIISFTSYTIILKYILKESLSTTTLEFLRIFVNGPSFKEPQYSSGKIFLITFIIAVFAVTSFIQGRLSFINTVPGFKPTIDSVHDLIESKLNIQGLLNYKDMIWHPEIRERFIPIHDITDCFNEVIKGNPVACMFPGLWLGYFLDDSPEIYVSKSNIAERSFTYLCSEDSPFLYKFNRILGQMLEGGIIDNFYKNDERFYLRNNTINDIKIQISMPKLSIFFYFLFGGWILTSFIFFMEILVHIMISN